MRSPRILFVTGSRLGDAVLTTGVLDGLIRAYPGAVVEVACGVLPAPIFADVPGLARIHVMTRRRHSRHWLSLWADTVGRRWDVVADLRGALLAYLLLARHRLVVRGEKRREHRVEELGRVLGLPAPPTPTCWISPERARAAAARLGDGPPILAVGPAANWGGKQWPAERFAELIGRLIAPGGILAGARVVVLAAAHEREAVAPVLAAVPPAYLIDRAGNHDLLDLQAELRLCSLYIGNDSGLLHLAAAAGTPTLGLFGPSPEWRYAPWGSRAAFVRTPESAEELFRSPAFNHLGHDSMMGGLTVETAVQAAERLWARIQA